MDGLEREPRSLVAADRLALTVQLASQPLGVLPGPPGALLLPDAGDADAFTRVRHGEAVALPAAWRFYQLAAAGDLDGALAALDGDGFVARYNRLVLAPDAGAYAALAADAPGDLAVLVETVAYLHGLRDDPPDAEASEPLVRAFALAAPGERAGLEAAAGLAEEASPAFAARLLTDAAALAVDEPAGIAAALELLERARRLYGRTSFAHERAEAALQYGQLAQSHSVGRRDRTLAAVQAYQEALQIFPREGAHASSYALAHMNLGLAYLSLPMNDEAGKLRPAIALQSLREAAAAVDEQRDAALWIAATVNLANALQHAPSTHVEDNLWEAVALYEDVVPHLPAGDVARRARVLANQGNALAHLGAFSRAVPRLEEARALFETVGDGDSAATLASLLDEIVARAAATGDAGGPA